MSTPTPSEIAASSTTELESIVAYVKKERPRALTMEERLDILMMHARMRLAGEKDVSNRIALFLGRNHSVVKSIWSDYKKTKSISVQKAPANRNNHPTRIPHTERVISTVREFLRSRQEMGLSSDASHVLNCLEQNGFIVVDRSDSKSVQTAIRAALRFQHKVGLISHRSNTSK